MLLRFVFLKEILIDGLKTRCCTSRPNFASIFYFLTFSQSYKSRKVSTLKLVLCEELISCRTRADGLGMCARNLCQPHWVWCEDFLLDHSVFQRWNNPQAYWSLSRAARREIRSARGKHLYKCLLKLLFCSRPISFLVYSLNATRSPCRSIISFDLTFVV